MTNNFVITLDLVKVPGVVLLTDPNGIQYYGVPASSLFLTERNAVMRLAAIAVDSDKYGKSHIVKEFVDSERYKAMTDYEKRVQPIIGAVKPYLRTPEPVSGTTTAAATFQIDNTPAGTAEPKSNAKKSKQ